jgi:hypothetical protein
MNELMISGDPWNRASEATMSNGQETKILYTNGTTSIIVGEPDVTVVPTGNPTFLRLSAPVGTRLTLRHAQSKPDKDHLLWSKNYPAGNESHESHVFCWGESEEGGPVPVQKQWNQGAA